jgi:hemerythrin-like metal-binding protein
MAAHGYPDCPAHKEKHEKMARKVKELHEQSRRGIISSPIQITNFLKDGLGKHIRDTDRRYGPYRTARGVR